VAAALFALAGQRAVSGKDLLHAFVLGIEAECRLGNAVTPGHYEHGWHITGTCGVFGAAAACSRVLGLNEAQVRNALGIAATQASGLVEMMGSEAKSLNGALAARNGLFAALLAATGFEGPEEPIEGAHGFINVLGGSRDLSRITRVPGSEWALAQVAYKPYPCGVVLHGLIDACLEARPQISLADVREINVTLHPLAIERADRPEPRTGLEAKLSAQHAAAVTLAQGQAGIAQFRDEAAADPQLAPIRKKVKLEPNARLTKAGAVVRIGSMRIEVLHARGTPERPMSDAELQAKFRALAGPRAEEWIGLVGSLEAVDKVPPPD
jgi:2-methylcitrate dehydratase PrpD